jgi:hypothetical protein
MVRIATNRAMSQQRKANWLETHNGIRDRLRPLAHEILSHARRKVQPGWKGILQNRKKDLIKSAFSPQTVEHGVGGLPGRLSPGGATRNFILSITVLKKMKTRPGEAWRASRASHAKTVRD